LLSSLQQPAWAGLIVFAEAGSAPRVEVELAETPSEWARGLMFRKGLERGAGMLFVFRDDRRRVFWMKNVRFSIDIIFMDKNFVIRKIWKSVPPCRGEPCATYPSGVEARYALEVSAGFCEKHGVRAGQRVEYTP